MIRDVLQEYMFGLLLSVDSNWLPIKEHIQEILRLIWKRTNPSLMYVWSPPVSVDSNWLPIKEHIQEILRLIWKRTNPSLMSIYQKN